MKLLTLILFWISTVHATTPYMEWFESDATQKKGQALVIHGLNSKPEKMMNIISEINKRGHDVLLLRLLGHNNDRQEFGKVTFQKWSQQVQEAFDEVLKRNQTVGGKITFIGHSLGGVMGVTFLAQNNHYQVDQMLLFAPAIQVKASSSMVKIFFPLGDEFTLPSMAPKEFRAHDGTTMAAYKALFEAINQLEKMSPESINIPTTVFIDPEDELVSYEKVLMFSNKLEQWRVVKVNKENSPDIVPYHHLILGPDTLGKSEWALKILPEMDLLL